MAEAARTLDIIDTRPAFVQADADALNARFEGVGTLDMLKTVFAEGLAGNVAVVSSFGTESAVLLHLVAQADPTVPVIFVDTLKMFAETLTYRDTLMDAFGFTDSRTVTPIAEVKAKTVSSGRSRLMRTARRRPSASWASASSSDHPTVGSFGSKAVSNRAAHALMSALRLSGRSSSSGGKQP